MPIFLSIVACLLTYIFPWRLIRGLFKNVFYKHYFIFSTCKYLAKYLDEHMGFLKMPICLSILACLLTYLLVPWRLIRGLILVSAFDLHGSLTFWSGLIEVCSLCRAFHIVVFSKWNLKVGICFKSWQIITLKI